METRRNISGRDHPSAEPEKDIDDRQKAEALLASENKILEMVATGKPLVVILEELCSLFDSISVHSMASVLPGRFRRLPSKRCRPPFPQGPPRTR
jgi:hypothetical protein